MSRSPSRAWLLLPAGFSLLAGLDAGLLLLEAPAPLDAAHLPEVHGPLMVLGFLGTLIALERAVALRVTAGYAAPALLGLGGLALAIGLPRSIGQVLLLDGSVALVLVLVALWRRRRDDPVVVEVLGAVLATLAALLWVRVDAAVVVPLLAGFVVLTIAAERVELARVHLPASADSALVAIAALVAATATGAVLFPTRARAPSASPSSSWSAGWRPGTSHGTPSTPPGSLGSARQPCSPATRGSPWPGSHGPSPG